MLIYHITTKTEWEKARSVGSYTADSLATEGFIHASTREQVVGTGNLIFKGQRGLILLAIDTDKLNSELKYELAPGTDQRFPHIYGPLNLDVVTDVSDFSAGEDGLFQFPFSPGA